MIGMNVWVGVPGLVLSSKSLLAWMCEWVYQAWYCQANLCALFLSLGNKVVCVCNFTSKHLTLFLNVIIVVKLCLVMWSDSIKLYHCLQWGSCFLLHLQRMVGYIYNNLSMCMCNVHLASWLLIWIACSSCYCRFLLELCQHGCSLYLNSVQHTKLYFYVKGSHFY